VSKRVLHFEILAFFIEQKDQSVDERTMEVESVVVQGVAIEEQRAQTTVNWRGRM
jgi:hypothetical protein